MSRKMRYFRHIKFKSVVTHTDDGPWQNEEPVIVIPLAQWQRLVEIVECYDPEADQIIASVEVPHD